MRVDNRPQASSLKPRRTAPRLCKRCRGHAFASVRGARRFQHSIAALPNGMTSWRSLGKLGVLSTASRACGLLFTDASRRVAPRATTRNHL